MTTESIGSAKASLTLDTSQFVGQIAAAKGQLAQFGTDAGRAFDESSGKARGAATSLARYIELIGKSADEAKILRAQWAGIDPAVLQPMVAQLQAIRAEEQANIDLIRMEAEARSQSQAKARAGYAELQQFARDEQLLREKNALQQLAQAQDKATAEQRQFNAAVQQSAQYSGEYGQRVNRMRDAVAAFTSEEFKAAEAARKTGGAHQVAAAQFNKYGLSAKQQVAAMRQVPMQLTDIFVSLQGGQRPMTVLIQQGGQLKDIFGGIVPAARALGGALLALINPWTVLAAVIGGVGYAYLQAEARQTEMQKSLILTGNYAQQSVSQMNQLASAVDDMVSGSSVGQATKAITEVVASAKFVGDQIATVTLAAEQMRDATGRAVSDTVEEFAKLTKDPVAGLIELNDKYHYLTAAQLENIITLKENGRETEAVTEAIRLHAAMIGERTPEILENMGLLQGAWHDFKNAAVGAWDAAVTAMGRFDRALKEDAGKALGTLFRSGGGVVGLVQGFVAAGAAVKDTTEAIEENEAVTTRQANALKKFHDREIASLTGEKKLLSDITKMRAEAAEAGLKANDPRVLAQEKALREAYAKTQSSKSKEAASLANATASAQLQAIKDALAQEQALLTNSGKLLEAQYSARLVTTKDYYAEQRRLLDASVNAEADALRKQIEVLRGRSVAGKDAVNVTKEMGKLEAQLAKVLADGATARSILTIKEDDASAKRQRAIDAYRESLDESNEALQASVNAEIARITMSEKSAQQQQKISEILASGAKEQRKLARELAESNDQETYYRKLAELQSYVDEQVRITEEGYARMDEAQSDWLNGVSTGIANWMDATSNVAAQTSAITNSALDSTANAFADLALKGKFSVRTLLADILSEISKFMMKQAVLNFLKAFASWYVGGQTGFDMNSAGSTDMGSVNGPYYAAKGAVFPGAAGLSAYSGSVVDKPTPFYFARGAGVMGEAGMEGIFPLERGADGKLGVKAIGGYGGGIAVNVNVTVNSDGSTQKQTTSQGQQADLVRSFGDRMAGIAREEIVRSTRPGGELWKMGVTTR